MTLRSLENTEYQHLITPFKLDSLSTKMYSSRGAPYQPEIEEIEQEEVEVEIIEPILPEGYTDKIVVNLI